MSLHIDDVTSLILAAQAAAYDAEGVDSLPLDDADGSLTRMAGTVLAFARDNGFDSIPGEFLRIACRMADEQNAHFAVQVVYDEYCRDRHAEETVGISRYSDSAYDAEKAHEIANPKPEPEPEPAAGSESEQAEENESDGVTASEENNANDTSEDASDDDVDDAGAITEDTDDDGVSSSDSGADTDIDNVANVDEAEAETETGNTTENTPDADVTNISDGSTPESTEISTEHVTDEVTA